MIKEKGLNGFQLKAIAAVLMVLDHFHFFYENIFKVPVIFTQLGRLSAPIFLFLLIEGFYYTKNRTKYFFRVYAVSIFMGVVRLLLQLFVDVYVRVPPFPLNGMLSTFTVIIASLIGFEMIKSKKNLGYAICFIVLVVPFFIKPLLVYPALTQVLNIINETVFPMHLYIIDGGTPFVLIGLVLYFFRGSIIKQAIAYIVACIGTYFYSLWLAGITLTPKTALYPYQQWMEIFAVVFFILYNNKRGKGSKWFFYAFYPAHIYILYGLALWIYPLLG